MKTTLTIEQSDTLISKGISPERASEIFIDAGAHGKFPTPKATGMMLECAHEAKIIGSIFTLSDLFSLLPKEIDAYQLTTVAYPNYWEVSYQLYDYSEFAEAVCSRDIKNRICRTELIDALYYILERVIEQQLFKFN